MLRVVGVTFRTGAVALAWQGLGPDRSAALLVRTQATSRAPSAASPVDSERHCGSGPIQDGDGDGDQVITRRGKRVDMTSRFSMYAAR